MFEAMVEWMGHPLYYTHFGGRAPQRSGPGPRDDRAVRPLSRGRRQARHASASRTSANGRRSAPACSAQPELAKDPRYDNNTKRTAARAEVVALIEGVFAALRRSRSSSGSTRAGIANARLNTPEEVWDHPQLKARERWREVGSPAGHDTGAAAARVVRRRRAAHGPRAARRGAHRGDPRGARLCGRDPCPIERPQAPYSSVSDFYPTRDRVPSRRKGGNGEETMTFSFLRS